MYIYFTRKRQCLNVAATQFVVQVSPYRPTNACTDLDVQYNILVFDSSSIASPEPSTVYRQLNSADIACPFAHQPDRRLCKFLGSSHTLERNEVDQLRVVGPVRLCLLHQRCIDEPRTNGIHSDSIRGVGHRIRPRQAQHARLGRRVRSRRSVRREAEDAAHVDDRAALRRHTLTQLARLQRRRLLHELPYLGAFAEPQAAEIDVDHAVKGFDVQVARADAGLARHPGAVDAVVDASEFLDALGNHSLDILFAGHVAHREHRLHFGVERLQFLRQAFETRAIQVREHEPRTPFVDQDFGASPANSRSSAGDEADTEGTYTAWVSKYFFGGVFNKQHKVKDAP